MYYSGIVRNANGRYFLDSGYGLFPPIELKDVKGPWAFEGRNCTVHAERGKVYRIWTIGLDMPFVYWTYDPQKGKVNVPMPESNEHF